MSVPKNSPPREGLLPERPVKWGIPDVVVLLAFAVALIVGQNLLASVRGLPHSDWLGVTIQTTFYLAIAALLVLVSKVRGLRSIRRDFGFELLWVDLLIGVGLAIVVQIANFAVYVFAVSVIHLPAAPTSNVSLPKTFGWAVFDGLAIASFFAPVVEELFFRGLVMRSVRNFVIRRAKFEGPLTTLRAARISILVSALVFAAAHLYEARNLTMLFTLGVSVFLFGVITAAVATRTGRLGPSMITHMLTNGLAAVLLLSSTH